MTRGPRLTRLRRISSDPVADILNDPRFKGAPVTWEVDGVEYDKIRRAWLTHVAAEEKLFAPHTEDEWQAQMATMLSVFTDDCEMALAATGESWRGKAGADQFYRALIPAFTGMEWVPQALVIGPQGVLDVVNVTGILVRDFAGLSAGSEPLHLQWVIFFPWVPEQGKFRGEKVFSIRPLSAIERRLANANQRVATSGDLPNTSASRARPRLTRSPTSASSPRRK